MGCDIHGWVEVRPYRSGRDYWRSVVNINYWERNYLIYARLFGVRNSFGVIPIAASRGLPITSKYANEEPEPRDIDVQKWEGDGHSHSWILFTEFEDDLQEIIKPYKHYNNYDKWWRLYQIMSLLAEQYGKDNVRIVVWFDN